MIHTKSLIKFFFKSYLDFCLKLATFHQNTVGNHDLILLEDNTLHLYNNTFTYLYISLPVHLTIYDDKLNPRPV